MPVALLIGSATPAGAVAKSDQPGDSGHTVKWFADNPRERARVELRCIDDPGHLGNTPDCINAKQARAELSYRLMIQSAQGKGPRYRASEPRYWSHNPDERVDRLNLCRTNIPSTSKAALYCDVARTSLVTDAGLVRR